MALSVEYVAKETASNLWRNRVMALAAILTVAVSLSLFGTALLLRQAVSRQISQWSNNVSLQIFLNPGVTKAQLASVNQLIDQLKGTQIKSCTYLDNQESYQQMKSLFQGESEVVQVLTPATTPPVFRCQLVNPSDAQTIANTFNGGVPGVYQPNGATYPGKSVKVLQQVTNVLQLVLLIIAIVLLISSLVLILNAIRMAIFARRREVGVMKLVGATNWFIRVPFMLEGLVQGLFGAVVAVVIVALSNIGVSSLITHYGVKVLSSSSLPANQLITIEVLVVLIGVVIGVVGSSLAVRRFLEV